MRVIVTGGAGFIGSHIVDQLLVAGHEPFVIDNFCSGSRENLPDSVPVFEADVCNGDEIARIFDEVQPELVCHQAAQMSVSVSVREPVFDADVNVMGLLNVFDNAARVGVKRIVFASSGGVLYGDVSTPASEDAPKAPISPYGISKWVGEKYLEFYAKRDGIKCVALRYANVYGPRQNPHGEAGVVAIFSERMLAGDAPTIFGDGSCIRDYVYVGDVARANVLSMTADFDGEFLALNIGTAEPSDVNRLSATIHSHAAKIWTDAGRTDAPPVANHGPDRAGDLKSSLVSYALAEEMLGWKPQVDFEQGLAQTVQWFHQKSPINSNV